MEAISNGTQDGFYPGVRKKLIWRINMLNTAILMGRLTSDPELRYTPNNTAVTSFTLAVERSYVKSGTDRQVDFIDVVVWRQTAEFVCKYFHKGQLAAVQGSIQTRSYTDKDGNKRKAFEVVAESVHFRGIQKKIRVMSLL